ncbi:hypothetical protein J14TS5_02110 [Paenibacillus lautus]|nr:hypothetical protein J14TS5_02110 [Paenibacillus lautus]
MAFSRTVFLKTQAYFGWSWIQWRRGFRDNPNQSPNCKKMIKKSCKGLEILRQLEYHKIGC